MLKAIILVGIPGSGKSTLAAKIIQEEDNFVELNFDNIRMEIVKKRFSEYEPEKHNLWKFWKHKMNKELDSIFEEQFQKAINERKNIVFSNKNTHNGRRDGLVQKMKNFGYDVHVIPVTTSYDVAVRQDMFRVNVIGANEIRKDWKRYNEFFNAHEMYVPKEGSVKAVMFDIDGTIAHMENRSPYDWDKVINDKPDFIMQIMIESLISKGFKIIYMSGRDSVCMKDTIDWLVKHYNADFGSDGNSVIFMRESQDQRKDSIIKRELFDRNVRDFYNVYSVFDDRPQVVRMWHDIGLKVWATGDQLIEF